MRFPIQPETIVPSAMQTSKAVTFFITSRLLSFAAPAAFTVLISLSKFSDASAGIGVDALYIGRKVFILIRF